MAYEGGSYRGALRKRGSGVMKGGGGAIPQYPLSTFILWRVGTVISGMWWRGGTVGWLGKMPRSSYQWACTGCHAKGRLEWSACGSPAGK